jgi:hypothetical protein
LFRDILAVLCPCLYLCSFSPHLKAGSASRSAVPQAAFRAVMAVAAAALLDEEQVRSGSLVAVPLPDGSRFDVELVALASPEDEPVVPAWSAESLPDA